MLLIVISAGFRGEAYAAKLIMVEQKFCQYCAAWNADIGVIYNKTEEGKRAPLRRVDIHDALPDDLSFINGVVFTPTFILVEGGKEFGRIRGYASEDFFWGLLQNLLDKLPAEEKISMINAVKFHLDGNKRVFVPAKKEELSHD